MMPARTGHGHPQPNNPRERRGITTPAQEGNILLFSSLRAATHSRTPSTFSLFSDPDTEDPYSLLSSTRSHTRSSRTTSLSVPNRRVSVSETATRLATPLYNVDAEEDYFDDSSPAYGYDENGSLVVLQPEDELTPRGGPHDPTSYYFELSSDSQPTPYDHRDQELSNRRQSFAADSDISYLELSPGGVDDDDDRVPYNNSELTSRRSSTTHHSITESEANLTLNPGEVEYRDVFRDELPFGRTRPRYYTPEEIAAQERRNEARILQRVQEVTNRLLPMIFKRLKPVSMQEPPEPVQISIRYVLSIGGEAMEEEKYKDIFYPRGVMYGSQEWVAWVRRTMGMAEGHMFTTRGGRAGAMECFGSGCRRNAVRLRSGILIWGLTRKKLQWWHASGLPVCEDVGCYEAGGQFLKGALGEGSKNWMRSEKYELLERLVNGF